MRAARRRGTTAAVLGLAAALARCGGPTAISAPAPAVPARWVSASGATDASASPAPDPLACLRALDDDLLTTLAAEARSANHDVRIARARVDEARARARAAGAALWPTVTASAGSALAGTTVDRPGDDTVRNSAAIDAGWEIDAFGRTRSLRSAAALDAATAVESVADAERMVVTETARLCVEARHIRARQALAAETIALQAQLVELAALSRDAGVADEGEVFAATTALDRSRLQLPALDAALQQTALALDGLLGAPPGSTRPRLEAAGAAGTGPAPVAPLPTPSEVVAARPDVRAAELRARAEVERLGAARAARYPSFRLSGSIGVEALTQLSIGTGAGAAYSLLAGITAPLFAGGRLRAQVRQQDAVVSQVWAGYEAAVLGALLDVEQALTAYNAAVEQLAHIEEIRGDTEAAFALVEARWGAGLVALDGLLDASAGRLALAESRADAERDRASALVSLCGALGGVDERAAGALSEGEGP